MERDPAPHFWLADVHRGAGIREAGQAFNEWLRSSDDFDGCVDFDAAVRDAADEKDFAPECDSGDHLHPSETACRRMAESVPGILLQ